MTARRRWRRTVLLGAVPLVLLGGCGNDTEDAGSSSPTSLPAKLASVVEDANRMAPALEGDLRGTDYPTTLAGAKRALVDAGIEPSGGNVVGGYAYDAETVEFQLCIESPDGAYATYDTRPMSMVTTGESGGCPAS